MYLSIILLPLLGSTVSGFFGRKSGITGSHIISTSSIILTTILSIIAFFEIGLNNNTVSISLFEWLVSESFNIVWNFQFDSLTVSMLIPVLVISSLVHIYSIGYMSNDPHNQRFFSYLNLFTFMMILLVTGNNYLLMFVGWEGVGVCSYLLVSFWFTRIAANQSSISAFLTNRVGDCFLIIGMLGLLWTLGNLDYSTVFSLAPYINTNVVTIIGICLLIGAMAKSAQIGLHIWLPMAMEGPTPVSALIHAATMVTAGVYLLIRSSPFIEYSSTLLLICLWLGAITTLSSSMIGLFQGDIKKIIAYSTMSQLGMMVIAIGLSSYNVALFHLINHAFYKGLLFLGAGAVIHAVADNQDLRKYGGLIHWLPLTYSVILIASLSLVAFPFMTGFYSKDLILESSYGQYNFPSIAVYFIGVIGAMFTTLYSVKVLYLTFIANPNGSLNYYKNAHEGNIYMSLPLVILAIFSIYFGFLTKDIYVGLGSGFFNNNSIFIHPMHEILISAEFGLNTIIKLLPFILTVTATAFAIILFEFYPYCTNKIKLSKIGYNIFGFFNQRLLIELFINKYIVNLVLKLGGQTTKVLDRGSIELIGPFGGEKLLLSVGKKINAFSTGMVTNYALYIIIGIIVYLAGSNFYLFNISNTLLLSILCIIILLSTSNLKAKSSTHVVLKSDITGLLHSII
jgi:NADH-ubiquinone oxidoreductase chain 5